MRILLTIITITLLLLPGCGGSDNRDNQRLPVEELKRLDMTILRAGDYANAVRRSIDSLAEVADKTPDPARASAIYADIAHQMSTLNSDTAEWYANKAVQLAEKSEVDSAITSAKIARLSALTSSGIFNLAEQGLREVETRKMSPNQRNYFWQVARQMYANLQMYTEDNFHISEEFRRRNMAYDDSLMMMLPEDHYFGRFLRAERCLLNGDLKSAKSKLDALMPSLKEGEHLYSMAAYQMALYYKKTGDEARYAEYTAKAAESDIKSGVREGVALFNLANWLYDRGEVEDAFRYINFAMSEAMAGDARMRAVNIASMLPMIDKTYEQRNKGAHDRITTLFIFTVTALAVAVSFLVLLILQQRKSSKIRKRIGELSKARERQLANFLALCTTYYHKLNSLEMIVRRKIASGQTEELSKLLKSGRYSDDDDEDIFASFDRAFIEIYPDFIEQINALLRPEERFSTATDGQLPAELRIYALITMGITESPRIAQILNYSVNTVYTYRNKMRNKAIDRETFEDTVACFEPFEEEK